MQCQALHAFPVSSFVAPQAEGLPSGFWGWNHGKTVRCGGFPFCLCMHKPACRMPRLRTLPDHSRHGIQVPQNNPQVLPIPAEPVVYMRLRFQPKT